MFSSLGWTLGWAQRGGLQEEGQPITGGRGTTGGMCVNVGSAGRSTLQEPLGRHKPLGNMVTLQVKWHLTKKTASYLERSVHKGAETGVCSVPWTL